MEVIDATGMVVGYTLGVEPSGRESLVVVVKGTFGFPAEGEDAALAPKQQDLIVADRFTGEPGRSAPATEVDFAPRKQRCDVLLEGSARTPGGRPEPRLAVGLRIGDWRKSFAVLGDRCWEAGFTGIRPGACEPFVAKPISYDIAFGGLDDFDDDLQEYRAYMANPVGRGWHRRLVSRQLDGSPMPNTEELERPVMVPDGEYTPMSFGPVGRGWSSRLVHAGTYDQRWIDETFPFLPADFNEAYYQAAPVDQQIPFLKGGEEVTLVNLTPEGRTSFRLPKIDVPVTFFRRAGGHEQRTAALDTIVLQPDLRMLTLTWRAQMPLRRNIFEIPAFLVGTMSSGWWRARELGKRWYPSLAHAVKRSRTAESETA